jgi:hypothetical protein
MARATAMTAGVRTAGSTCADIVTTESAATGAPCWPRIGAATVVTGSGHCLDMITVPCCRYRSQLGSQLDQDRLLAVPDREQDVLAGRVMKVLEVRQRRRPQPVPPRSQRGDLKQPQPDHVLAVSRLLKRAPLHQLARQAQGGRLRQAGPGAQRGERKRAVRRPEGRHDPERPVQDRLAARGLAPARRWSAGRRPA